MNKLLSCSLWQQVTLLLFTVALLVTLIAGEVARHFVSKELMADIKKQSEKTFSILIATSLNAVITEDIPLLETSTIEAGKSDTDILAITFRNERGLSLVDWKKLDYQENTPKLTFNLQIIFSLQVLLVSLHYQLFGLIKQFQALPLQCLHNEPKTLLNIVHQFLLYLSYF